MPNYAAVTALVTPVFISKKSNVLLWGTDENFDHRYEQVETEQKPLFEEACKDWTELYLKNMNSDPEFEWEIIPTVPYYKKRGVFDKKPGGYSCVADGDCISSGGIPGQTWDLRAHKGRFLCYVKLLRIYRRRDCLV